MKEQEQLNPPSQTEILDKQYIWHPFTQMREWTSPEFRPVVITRGQGALLFDEQGREYFDGNASIWTNLHGHNHPAINEAIRRQLDRLDHCSFLGLTHDVAPPLAQKLVQWADVEEKKYRVFFSDDGATAIEAGLKIILQARRQRGEPERQKFISLAGGYHGDTVGAMSLGHSSLFHGAYGSILFPSIETPCPGCYRCPWNKAKPERGFDARQTRKCQWECVQSLDRILTKNRDSVAACVMEPLIQGAAGMIMHAPGYLKSAAELCQKHGAWLMLDEVMTGFGRTGSMFAYSREGVKPDVIALSKGITGGTLPLAATLSSEEIYNEFLGEYDEFKTFFHGHSYTANPIGCAAALANLEWMEQDRFFEGLALKSSWLKKAGDIFWKHPSVGDVRQEGLVWAAELVSDFATRRPFPLAERIGFKVSLAAQKRGLLIRPIGNVLLLMPPYCVSEEQIDKMVEALWEALNEVLPG